MQEDRVMRRAEVEAVTSLTERRIRILEDEGKFPRRFAVTPGGRFVGWSFCEVQEWLRQRKEAREQPALRGMAQPGEQIGRGARSADNAA